MKERIIDQAAKLFNQFGVKAVRLEDMAQALGISKKTLYQHFRDKEELVQLMLESQLNEALHEANAIHTHASNAIVEALMIWDRLIRYHRTTNPNLLRDIERHYPAPWSLFQSFRAEYINTILAANLRRGIIQELYRADLNESVIARVWIEQSQWDIPQKDDAAENAIKHHFVRGLLTQKGLAVYERLRP